MEKGIVKWFSFKKGYGFLTSDEGVDTFVHYSGIDSEKRIKSIKKNDVVEYFIIDGEKGPQADKVKVIKATASV